MKAQTFFLAVFLAAVPVSGQTTVALPVSTAAAKSPEQKTPPAASSAAASKPAGAAASAKAATATTSATKAMVSAADSSARQTPSKVPTADYVKAQNAPAKTASGSPSVQKKPPQKPDTQKIARPGKPSGMATPAPVNPAAKHTDGATYSDDLRPAGKPGAKKTSEPAKLKSADKPTAQPIPVVEVELEAADPQPAVASAASQPKTSEPAALAPEIKPTQPAATLELLPIPTAAVAVATSAASVPSDNTIPPPATEKPSYSEIVSNLALLLELSDEEKSDLRRRLSKDEDDYVSLKKKYDEAAKELAKGRKELQQLREEYDRVTGQDHISEIVQDRLETDQKAKYKIMLEEEAAARSARLAAAAAPAVPVTAPKAPEAPKAPSEKPAQAKDTPAKKPAARAKVTPKKVREKQAPKPAPKQKSAPATEKVATAKPTQNPTAPKVAGLTSAKTQPAAAVPQPKPQTVQQPAPKP